jgi:RNA polymerase sigma-70 factor, ECF subfamily
MGAHSLGITSTVVMPVSYSIVTRGLTYMTSPQKTRQQTLLTSAHHTYEKGLNAHAFFKTHNHETGEDLVQDTFMKTWKYLVKGGRIDVMKAFLYHILNNLIVDEYRKRKTTSLDALLEKGYEPGADHSERLFNTLDGKVALLLIQRLPERYRKVMRMRYVQDLSLSEMSLITGQSKNTTAVQVHRGLEKLKLLYDHA